MPQAARLADPIGHSPTMNWLLAGLLAGAAIAVAGVAIVGTGGLAAVAIVGSGAALGAGIGEVISTISWAPKEVCGVITGACSSNVFTNGRPAARVNVDFAICSKHPGAPLPIVNGSDSVFINGQPAARVADAISCGAVITSGSNNVYIGGGRTGPIPSESLVPAGVHAALLVVGISAAVVLAGPVVAAGALVAGIVGGAAGAWLGGKLFGEGSDGQKWSALAGGLLGGVLGAKGVSAASRLGGARSARALGKPASPDRGAEAIAALKNKWGSDKVAKALADKRKNPELEKLLTDSEYLSIRGYTSHLYKDINPALRGGNPGEWASVTDEAVSGMNKLTENGGAYAGIVRRDARFTQAELEELFPVGGKFSDQAFLSTTSDLDGMPAFAGNTKIFISGKSGVGVRSVSELPGEAEVLFKPNTEFRVVSRTVNPTTGKTEIVLEELP